MITKAANVPASVADRRGLIDLVATSERSLLRELDGFELAGPRKRTLRTAGLAIKRPAIDTPLEDSGGSGDGPSIGLILGLVVVVGLGVVGLQRGRSVWRRRKWLYRRWRGERRARQRRP